MIMGWRDVRFGLRMLARNKGFAAVAILALALGIGPNVAMFSIIWATFLAPQPYPQADRLVVVWNHYRGERFGTRAQDYAAFAAASRSFENLAFSSWTTLQFTSADHAVESVYGHATTPGDITKMLGLPMALGRDFLPGEGTPGNDRVVILTHRLWETRFHGDPGILGKPVLIEDQAYTVVGILDAGPLDRAAGTEFIVPINPQPGVEDRASGNMIGRLKPGVTLAQAQAEMAAIDHRLAPDRYGATDAASWSVSVEPFHNDGLDRTLARNLWLLLAAVGLVLLIACSNLANLLLARGAARQQELALRTALGATRRQIVAQLLTESLTLALLGGAAGVSLGWGIMKASLAILPLVTQSAEATVQINVPVLCFALGITVLGGIIFGCAPAWQAAYGGLAETLKQGARSHSSRGRTRTQGLLVTAEFALALTLLAGAGLALHSFWNLSRVDLGIRAENLLTGDLARRTPGSGQNHAAVPPPQQIVVQLQQLLHRVGAVPGVEDAALAERLPLHGRNYWSFSINGRPTDAQHRLTADFEQVTPGFRQTLGVRMLRGRFLEESDRLGTPLVGVISESFARRFFAGADPLTQRLTLALPDPVRNEPGPLAPVQIVGVFHDILNNRQLTGTAEPEVLLSLWQLPWPDGSLAVRTTGDPGAVAAALRSAVAAAQPGLSLEDVESMQEVVAGDLTFFRFGMVLLVGFAGVALLLAALGIYGVMSFAVSQRTHEVGIRMALGAEKSAVVSMMVRSGIRLAVPGMALGLAGAFLLGRMMRSTLYGVGAVDYVNTALVATLLLAVGLFACWLPARRSAQVDPIVALREQ